MDGFANSPPPSGHNNPPDPIEILREHLAETYADLAARGVALLDMESRLPADMDDEWEAKVSEAIKACTKFVGNSEVSRLAANEPHRALIAATDAYFKKTSDKVAALKAKLTRDYLTPWQQQKAAAEKARREAEAAEARRVQEEEARRQREEQARLAEIQRQEAAARAEVERQEREAREAAERAERQKQEAARQAAEATNRATRAAAARAQQEAAEHQRQADEEERKAREARAAEARAVAERQRQEAEEKAAREAEEEARAATAKAEKAAAAKAADMHTSRTDLGARSGLRTVWKWRQVKGQEDQIPRTYLEVSAPAITAAVRAATTKDGRCDLAIPGIEIYPETSSVVR